MSLAARACWLGLVAYLTLSCTPGPPRPSWVDPSVTPRPYRHLLVVGVAPNPKIRRVYEDNFATALRATGIQARSAHAVLSDAEVAGSSTLRKAVERSRADGVIVTHLTRAEQHEGPTHVNPRLHGRLDLYYNRVVNELSSPTYYASSPALRLETNLYDARRGTLVWSSRSDLLDPSSEETRISQVIATSIERLRMDGFLPR
ncbi:MAG: hypothetical protein EOM91_06715 [Sphingobacteriia bacterium]|nr:hypothetical protein [Sphingobacteriia bacterium]NCC38146.1 hypothetical protein [Gammaproteobacteria bacterium]